jgi:hypothetical protein
MWLCYPFGGRASDRPSAEAGEDLALIELEEALLVGADLVDVDVV